MNDYPVSRLAVLRFLERVQERDLARSRRRTPGDRSAAHIPRCHPHGFFARIR
ncbi:hypothetical protein [Streptomyces mirabilis]|uniref:hypothetical protein n=1 Tax=Streptomyces mirabilis TaxID=68239 RepID=UPI0015A72860|nr:hypothetical protein [Streptomyces mirabilis]